MKIFAALYVFAYFLIRYVLLERITGSEIAIYAFEVFFVVVGLFVFKFTKPKWVRINPIGLLITLVCGGFVFCFTQLNSWIVPLDFQSIQTVVLLLIVAPILEEFIYRYALWNAIERVGNVRISFALTSVLFSLSHFYAYFFVPEEYKGFVTFQAIYTLGLALTCGYQRMKKNSVFPAIVLHFLFNLGFYIAGYSLSIS